MLGRLRTRAQPNRAKPVNPPDSPPAPDADAPSPTQRAAYFSTFGALVVPGAFRAEVERIEAGFERVFAREPSDPVDPAVSLHKVVDPSLGSPRRQIAGTFIERDPDLLWLRDDARIRELATAILGDGCAYNGSTGNLFNSYISWHSDYFHSPIPTDRRIKFAFYLDPLTRASGSLRVIPGTHHRGPLRAELFDEGETFAPDHLERKFGMADDELPHWPLEVMPGDLVIFDNAVLHASFGGSSRRRMFSVQFRAAHPGSTLGPESDAGAP